MTMTSGHIGKYYCGEPASIVISMQSELHKNLGVLLFSIIHAHTQCHIILRSTGNQYKFNDLPSDIKLLCSANLVEYQQDSKTGITIEPGFRYNEAYQCPELVLPDNILYPQPLIADMVASAIKHSPAPKLDVIVSLTTWKGRIFHPNFPDNLLSLLSQNTTFNYKVVLVLSRDEFGTDFIIPPQIDRLANMFAHFEILWTKRNTKALKNYNPTAQKYQHTPIIVLGDDTIYKNTLVQTVFTTFLNSDRKTCFGFYISESSKKYNILSPFRIRIFPPNCMYDLDENYFDDYFHGHNDLFNGLRLRLANTKVMKGEWPILWEQAFAQEVRLTEYHKIPEETMIDTFLIEHPEIKTLL